MRSNSAILAPWRKRELIYTCGNCGGQQPKWQGQCPDCGAWNTPDRIGRDAEALRARAVHRPSRVHASRSRRHEPVGRLTTGLGEFDRVLGGGLVPGGVVLHRRRSRNRQIDVAAARARESRAASSDLLRHRRRVARADRACARSVSESVRRRSTCSRRPASKLCSRGVAAQPKLGVLAIDSIQTLFSEELQSAPGSVSQVRECAAQLMRFAKSRQRRDAADRACHQGGHARGSARARAHGGHRSVLRKRLGSRFRIVRAVKNRFGAANEMGFFVMGEEGFREVKNPSAIFLARHGAPVRGQRDARDARGHATGARSRCRRSSIERRAQSPRRLAQGFDTQRLGCCSRFCTGIAASRREKRRVREYRRRFARRRDGGRPRRRPRRRLEPERTPACRRISPCSASSG